eukprot:5599897-Prorocentrum_lima.AAC.1
MRRRRRRRRSMLTIAWGSFWCIARREKVADDCLPYREAFGALGQTADPEAAAPNPDVDSPHPEAAASGEPRG